MRLPELLCPAGDLSRLKAAIHFGADAVYLAGETMGMRSASRNFTIPQLAQATEYAHTRGKKVYLACNAMLRNDQVDALPKLLPQWADCGVDALIAGDLGALRIIKRLLPDMPVHISVQTGLANYEAVRAMADFGACRAILSRELVLDEIATIRAKTPGCIELEAFVHGSMCVSVSGRCLLSDYMTMQQSIPPHNDDNAGAKTVPGVDDKEKGSDDDASLVDGLFTGLSVDKSVCTDRQMVTDDENALNSGLPLADLNTHFIVHDKAACPPDDTAQAAIASPLSCRSGNGGDCAQPCRWKYALMEEKRPGEYYPVYETQEGSFLLNSKDLCMISHLSDMAEAGVTSLKIEGRAKSAYYAAVTANAYRCALDEWRERGYPHAFSPSHWMVEELDKVSHRPYSTGFYLGGRGGQHTAGGGYVRDYEVMGVVIDSVPGRVHVSQRNKLYTGDRVELLEPGRPPIACTVSDLFDAEGNAIQSTPHPTMQYSFALEHAVQPGTLIRRARQI